ncbi:MAG: aminotransferase class V-fold PLP-dependent enzyme, partial [Candidatus Aenigmarchaeota archaeon]|nr:aminotransferase class V-fold PLP-dependent enzyme [Candidatus Aenigmarchaeota archaeon]
GIVGLGKATELVVKKELDKMESLRSKLINGLLSIKDSKLNGPNNGKRLCNNVDISFKGIEGESLLTYLGSKGIYISTGSACSSGEEGPSHVLKAIGVNEECIMGSVRFTLSRFITEKEIDHTMKHVKEVVAHLRKVRSVK